MLLLFNILPDPPSLMDRTMSELRLTYERHMVAPGVPRRPHNELGTERIHANGVAKFPQCAWLPARLERLIHLVPSQTLLCQSRPWYLVGRLAEGAKSTSTGTDKTTVGI
jgi:hypothetical protein